jgi:peptide/nickel transport system substrate-binding protein
MLTRRALLAASASAPLSYLALDQAFAETPKTLIAMAKQIDDIISFDPAESYEFTDNEVDANCYRKLVVPNVEDPTKIVGDLAEKWDVSQDGLTLTFHLRKDAVFDSGKPVTAEDAEFSLHRVVMLDKTPGFIITQFGFTKDNVAKLIRATDPQTLVIQLPDVQATSFVLACLTANVACIVEKATAMAHAANNDYGNAWLKTNSAGAGPYRLVSWAASDHVIVEANPHYTPAPAIKRFVIRHVKDPGAQLLLLQKGDVDIARDLNSDQLKTVGASKDYHTVSAGQLSSMYIAINQNVPELAKPQVHQAIKWAIDYDAIAKNITPGRWVVGQSFLPKGLPGAITEPPFKKDVAKAKQLMSEAGLANGFSVTMDFISASPYSEVAQAIQQDLAAIGIKVSLAPGEQKQVITKTRARTHQLAMLVWGSDYFDPNSNAQAFCANPDDSDGSKLKIIAWRSHFKDDELTREAGEAAKELDSAKRSALYEKMQQQFFDRAPFAFVLQQVTVAVMRKNVSGFAVGPEPDFTRYLDTKKT